MTDVRDNPDDYPADTAGRCAGGGGPPGGAGHPAHDRGGRGGRAHSRRRCHRAGPPGCGDRAARRLGAARGGHLGAGGYTPASCRKCRSVSRPASRCRSSADCVAPFDAVQRDGGPRRGAGNVSPGDGVLPSRRRLRSGDAAAARRRALARHPSCCFHCRRPSACHRARTARRSLADARRSDHRRCGQRCRARYRTAGR